MIRQEVNIQNIFTSETIEKVNTYHLIFIDAYAILTMDGMVAVNLMQIEPLRVEGICLYHDG